MMVKVNQSEARQELADHTVALQRLTNMANIWTTMTTLAAIIILFIGGIAYFTGADTNITKLMNGVCIAAMVLVLINALVLMSIFWFRTNSSAGLDGFVIVGLVQNKVGQALIASLLIFIATFQIYSTARITPA
jgi:hypothetical protein